MHLFEAFMAAFEATDDCLFLGLADQIFDLFETRFYDSETGCLLEYFRSDWCPQNKAKAKVEPGHMMEWCWLLEWYERLSGKPMKSYVDALFSSSIKKGLNPRTGLLINEFRLDGTISNASSRLWPQTEFIKACIAKYRQGDADALSLASLVIDRLFYSYLQTPLRGGWHDSLDFNGKTETSQMPASTFYHLACTVAELEKVNEELNATAPDQQVLA
jgi:mannose-6-phosphate isomerase